MARSRRASSSVASSINGGQAIQTSPPPSLPQPSSNTVGRFKKASKLATSFLKQLKSPSNSDGEDSDDDDGNDSDLDFGCSGLQDAFDELDELLLADSAELHISLEKSLLQSIQQDGGEHSAQLNLDMPTRSSSIAVSVQSSSYSISPFLTLSSYYIHHPFRDSPFCHCRKEGLFGHSSTVSLSAHPLFDTFPPRSVLMHRTERHC